MFKTRPFTRLFSVFALATLLAACDGGSVSNSANPNLSTGGGSKFVYTGPAARDQDVSKFQEYLWKKIVNDGNCADCHNSQASSPVVPTFFDTSNVNVAYDQAISRVDLVTPSASDFVDKLATPPNGGRGPHFCWHSSSDLCANDIEVWINDWKNADTGGLASRAIELEIPANIRDPGNAKSFPPNVTDGGANSFANTVYPLLVGTNPPLANNNCRNCHEEIATPLPQAPFFASGDIDSAYEAAKAKMDIDTPSNSRFVQRLIEQHNCWNDCGISATDAGSDANLMRARIAQFAGGITPTQVTAGLVTSKALTLGEGIIASGGNRHETDQFALWEFKTGTGLTAYDTSAVPPAINLSLIGSVNWVGGYGLEFTGGRAQADTVNSDKLFTYLQDTQQYAVEAWVIPANVSQEDANIVSYSGGGTTRNFTLSQTLYNYESYNRIDVIPPAPNGDPLVTTGENGLEVAQASLQHVVVNYDRFSGREVYVNGALVPGLTDSAAQPTTIANVWDDTFAFILGNEIDGSRPWRGQVKMVAIHDQVLTPAQVQQNFDVGVGQKFFLLFYIGHHLGEGPAPLANQDASFIMFEVAQFDSFSYLFNNPTYINLNQGWTPRAINLKGMRIGINGKEAVAGQAFASMDFTVNPGTYDPATGQVMSPIGTIIALEKGPTTDEFFLTFEDLDGEVNAFTDIQPTLADDPSDPAAAVESDIGVRTFEEINTTIAAITGIPVTNGAVDSVYDDYIQQLPSVETIDAFLPSHQMAIAQLALTSCSELVDNNPGYFAPFVFSGAQTAFDSPTKRAQMMDPLLTAVMNVDQVTPANNLDTQPAEAEILGLLGDVAQQNLTEDPQNQNPNFGPNYGAYDSLIDELLSNDNSDTTARTEQIVKAVCAVAAGGAVMLVQ